jgi:threonine/homoserine/homoserine lactone efflux protein
VDIGPFAAFAVASLLIELTPGPNMVWLAIVATTDGRRTGYAAVAGVALGLAVIGGTAAFGLAAVIAASPDAYQALRWAGVAYLLWLAWDAWRAADGPPDVATAMSHATAFRRGLVTNILNPKAFVFYVTVLPGFLPGGGGLADTMMLTAIYVAMATAVHTLIVTGAGTARDWLQTEGRAMRVRRGLALALVGVAVWVALK